MRSIASPECDHGDALGAVTISNADVTAASDAERHVRNLASRHVMSRHVTTIVPRMYWWMPQ